MTPSPSNPPPTDDNPLMFEEPITDVPNRFGVRLNAGQNTITFPMPLPSGMTRSNALELAAHLIQIADEFDDAGTPQWSPKLAATLRG